MGLFLFSCRVHELDETRLVIGVGCYNFGRFIESIPFPERGITVPSEDEVQPADVSSQVAQLRELIGGYRTQLIYVVAKLGIADLLKDGPKLIDELADSTVANARNLFVVRLGDNQRRRVAPGLGRPPPLTECWCAGRAARRKTLACWRQGATTGS